jgi:hypothetical protein
LSLIAATLLLFQETGDLAGQLCVSPKVYALIREGEKKWEVSIHEKSDASGSDKVEDAGSNNTYNSFALIT